MFLKEADKSFVCPLKHPLNYSLGLKGAIKVLFLLLPYLIQVDTEIAGPAKI